MVHRVDVMTTQDDIDEHDETFTITLSNLQGAAAMGNDLLMRGLGGGTIYDDDLPPTLVVADAEAYEGSTVNFTVTLSASERESGDGRGYSYHCYPYPDGTTIPPTEAAPLTAETGDFTCWWATDFDS